MKKSHKICLIVILLNCFILNLNSVFFSPAVPVDPSNYTFNTDVDDKRTYTYNNIISLHPNGSKLKTMDIQLSFGGFLKNVTLSSGDKVEVKITDINKTTITFEDTFILQNGSEFIPDPFYQRIDNFRVGYDITFAIMTTNTTLIDVALSQTTIDAYWLEDSYMYFENESRYYGDSNMSVRSTYYRATGWLASMSVDNYNSTLDLSSYDLAIEIIDTKNIYVEVDPSYFTVGGLQAGDVRTYFIKKYTGNEIFQGIFVNVTIDAIDFYSIVFSQVLYFPNGTIFQTASGMEISRDYLYFTPSLLTTTNTTLINEVLSGSGWEATYLNDVMEFKIAVEEPDFNRKEYCHCRYDLTSGWLINMYQVLYNTSEGETIIGEVEYGLYDPVHVSVKVNPAHYTLGDIQTGDQKTYEFIKFDDPYSFYGGKDYNSGDLTNLTITNIDETKIEYTQVIFKPTGEVIDTLGGFSIDLNYISQPHSIFMTTNTTLINEVFLNTEWEIIYNGGFVRFELEFKRPEVQLKEYYNFTYDLNSGWFERYYTKITNTSGTVLYEVDARLFKEPEKPPETTISSETTVSTSSQPSSSESSAPDIQITSLPGLVTLVGLVSIVIIIRKQKLV
ncbi:MAG: hypothetical protein ACFFB5_11115 [Promethearchaeota archaeon]